MTPERCDVCGEAIYGKECKTCKSYEDAGIEIEPITYREMLDDQRAEEAEGVDYERRR